MIGLSATSVTLFGDSVNSFYEVNVNTLLDGTSLVIDENRFPDGYYEIRLDVVHTVEGAMDDTISEGFLANTFCKASQLPLLIDFNNFDPQELRMQTLLISLLNSTKRAAELGREVQFINKTKTINAFLNARNLSEVW